MASSRIVSLLLSFLFFCCFFVPNTRATCDLSGYTNYPSPICAYTPYNQGGCPCIETPGTTIGLAPTGQTWSSYYAYLLPLIGVDGVAANEAWVNPNTTDPNIYLTAPHNTMCNLTVVWIASVASFRNRIGYILFDRKTGQIDQNSFTLLYHETSIGCVNNSNNLHAPNKTVDVGGEYRSCLPQGSTLHLGPFAGDSSIGWYLEQNEGCSCNNSKNSPHNREYSIDKDNMYIINGFDSTQRSKFKLLLTGRLMAVFREPYTGRVSLSFEDFPGGGDEDYNDAAFAVSSDCPYNLTKLPCNEGGSCPPGKEFDLETCTCVCPYTCHGALVNNLTTCECYCPLSADTCAPPYQFNSTTCECFCIPGVTCPGGDGGLTSGQTAGVAVGAVVGAVLAGLAALGIFAAIAAAIFAFKFFKKGESVPQLDAAINDDTDKDVANESPLWDNPVQEFANPLGGKGV